MNTGDEVYYVPDECHAFHKDAQGNFSWHIESAGEANSRRLTSQEITDRLFHSRQNPQVSAQLRKVAPATSWAATVDNVNEDGSVDLAVPVPGTGATNYYERVPCDPKGKRPHTFHVKEEA